MKHPILLLIVLPLLLLIGCAAVPAEGGGEMNKEPETVPASEVRLDLIGISYAWRSGSMAGMNYTYSVSKEPAGVCLFHAELEAEGRIVDREISQEEFDAIMQLVNGNDAAMPAAEGADTDDGYVALDADSAGFEAIFADGQTQSIHLGQASSQVLSQLKTLLEESPAE